MDRLIEDERDRKRLVAYINHQKVPFVCKVTSGRIRSIEQNRLAWLWATEVALQCGDRYAPDVHAQWKLSFGLPILLVEDEDFARDWQASAASLSYEKQLRLMRHFPVTRIMSSKQLSSFLDQIQQHYAELGFELTNPEDRMVAA